MYPLLPSKFAKKILLFFIFLNILIKKKNSVGKIIILYDEDERLVISAGTTMVERGFDNIFVLSGGNYHLKFF